jgi:hypothetical protein
VGVRSCHPGPARSVDSQVQCGVRSASPWIVGRFVGGTRYLNYRNGEMWVPVEALIRLCEGAGTSAVCPIIERSVNSIPCLPRALRALPEQDAQKRWSDTGAHRSNACGHRPDWSC